MRLATPKAKWARDGLFLAVELPAEELPVLGRFWFPWRRDEAHGEDLVHVSSAPFLVSSVIFRGFADGLARARVKAWLREGALSLSHVGKRTRTSGYPWCDRMSPDFEPRPFQLAGMDRLYARIRILGRGMVHGDSVGLGKTIQVLGVASRLMHEKRISAAAPLVVVTLASVKSQWGDETRRFIRPEPRVRVIDGPRRERLARLGSPAEVYVLNYSMAVLPAYRDPTGSLLRRAGMVVLDESYVVKNPESKIKAAIDGCVRGKIVVPLNATPIENRLGDFWSQVNAVDCGAMEGAFRDFSRRYVYPSGKARRIVEFKKRAAPMYLKRHRDEVADQLPRVVAKITPVELGRKQEAAYRRAAGEYLADNARGAVARSRIWPVLYAGFCADIQDPGSESAKLDALEGLLEGELASERVVVFSRSSRVIDFAARRLARFRPAVVQGKTPQAARDETRRRWGSVHGAALAGDRGAGPRGEPAGRGRGGEPGAPVDRRQAPAARGPRGPDRPNPGVGPGG